MYMYTGRPAGRPAHASTSSCVSHTACMPMPAIGCIILDCLHRSFTAILAEAMIMKWLKDECEMKRNQIKIVVLYICYQDCHAL